MVYEVFEVENRKTKNDLGWNLEQFQMVKLLKANGDSTFDVTVIKALAIVDIWDLRLNFHPRSIINFLVELLQYCLMFFRFRFGRSIACPGSINWVYDV